MVGNILLALAFTLIGPAPYLAELIPNSIGLSYFVAVLIGVGYAHIMVARQDFVRNVPPRTVFSAQVKFILRSG